MFASLAILALLTMQGTQDPAETAAHEEAKQNEIVVIGDKLKNWTAKVRSKDGKWTCKTTRSTGDVQIDAIGCDAMTFCMKATEMAVEMQAIQQLKRKERKARQKALNKAFGSCTFEKRADMINELAARRSR